MSTRAPAEWTVEGLELGILTMSRILIAGVGYSNLTDLSLGPILFEHLVKRTWPEGTDVEDFSYGPLFILHFLGERAAYDRIILIGAVERERKPGSIRRYRWMNAMPHAEEIQARVIEAGTGVISLENLLVVATQFKKLPTEVVVLEVEPFDSSFGETLSEEMSAMLEPLADEIADVWTIPGPLPPVDDYEYIIANAADRPTGWAVGPVRDESN